MPLARWTTTSTISSRVNNDYQIHIYSYFTYEGKKLQEEIEITRENSFLVSILIKIMGEFCSFFVKLFFFCSFFKFSPKSCYIMPYH